MWQRNLTCSRRGCFKPARKRAAGLLCPPVQRCGGCRNPSGARYERGEGQAGGSGCGAVRPRRVAIHGGGRRLGRRLGQAVEGGTGESPESRKQRVRGGQDAKGGTGESLGPRGSSRLPQERSWLACTRTIIPRTETDIIMMRGRSIISDGMEGEFMAACGCFVPSDPSRTLQWPWPHGCLLHGAQLQSRSARHAKTLKPAVGYSLVRGS